MRLSGRSLSASAPARPTDSSGGRAASRHTDRTRRQPGAFLGSPPPPVTRGWALSAGRPRAGPPEPGTEPGTEGQPGQGTGNGPPRL